MKAVLLLLVLLVLGAGAGAGVAWFGPWQPARDMADGTDAPPVADPAPGAGAEAAPAPAAPGLPVASAIRPDADYQRLDDPFLVPLVRDNAVAAMMVLTLGLEVAPGQSDLIRRREPRLRNQLLQALFDHANTGGFDGMFTGAANMRALRESLTRAARDVVGDAAGSVLILDMVRQEG
ncbi:MAG: flagellar basal body-associated FliL family protein [Rubellimicrobium sp.]|nr:flagellar basal body-associated FliL family protein [Rubellimicrobium sp.]